MTSILKNGKKTDLQGSKAEGKWWDFYLIPHFLLALIRRFNSRHTEWPKGKSPSDPCSHSNICHSLPWGDSNVCHGLPWRDSNVCHSLLWSHINSIKKFIVCHILPLSHINSMFAKFYHAATSIRCLLYSTKQTVHDHILQSVHWMHDEGINKSRYWYVSSLIFYSISSCKGSKKPEHITSVTS